MCAGAHARARVRPARRWCPLERSAHGALVKNQLVLSEQACPQVVSSSSCVNAVVVALVRMSPRRECVSCLYRVAKCLISTATTFSLLLFHINRTINIHTIADADVGAHKSAQIVSGAFDYARHTRTVLLFTSCPRSARRRRRHCHFGRTK